MHPKTGPQCRGSTYTKTMRTPRTLALTMAALALTACGSDTETETDAVAEETTTTVAEPEETTEAPTRTPTPRATPTPDPLPTHLIGDEITMADAKVTILTIEAVDQIETDQYADTLVPADGESLHYVTWEWVNLSNEAGWGVCWGPVDTYLTLYDQNDREMPRHPDWAFAAGNDCETEVLTGQGGVVRDAYRGLEDSEITYMTLVNHSNNTREIIVVDPDVVIYED